jgi:hypothetical protein
LNGINLFTQLQKTNRKQSFFAVLRVN